MKKDLVVIKSDTFVNKKNSETWAMRVADLLELCFGLKSLQISFRNEIGELLVMLLASDKIHTYK
jgi:hypothetical protein